MSLWLETLPGYLMHAPVLRLLLLLLLLFLQDMLRRLLAYDPRERLSLEEALEHPFLRKPSAGAKLADRIEETLLALEKQ